MYRTLGIVAVIACLSLGPSLLDLPMALGQPNAWLGAGARHNASGERLVRNGEQEWRPGAEHPPDLRQDPFDNHIVSDRSYDLGGG